MAQEKSHYGKTIVITGASSGLGKEVARQLAKDGANLVLAARRTGLIEALASELGPNAIAVTMDVSREADVAWLFEEALISFGKIDVWINNAGVGVIGPFTDIPLEDLARMIEVNVKGTLNGSHFALRHFKEIGSGTLINIGSVASDVAYPYFTGYSASKHAILGFSSALNEEVKLEGYPNIHICSVLPWATDTPWFEHADNYSGHVVDMKPMDDPRDAVEAIIRLIDEPQEVVEIGRKMKSVRLLTRFIPKRTEKRRDQFVKVNGEETPPESPKSGTLHEPEEPQQKDENPQA
ncbi:SDR family NAD(P)-dependent oxidoreductase [Planococcus sp. ISL-109]|uniref:SDR family NAD(P)-dependent oxidoreductase n=1 Tax=Planococcus sp. ISL-109 TaxID=2819166 RepID=UPI001BEB16E3|nr:SDR family NAD(P)-dependent oxidoreductase [Planococcus sp. ISL-109]MBT2582794.1 SDR family NAD(P)-dependent oxidoreductase [Planococcus sp. ISL-109]